MRALNVVLCLVVSLALAALVAEGALRLVGLGPRPTINRFDPDTGWSMRPDAEVRRATREFDVTIATNRHGLRDDPLPQTGKPAGSRRVLCVGDSFTLGYTVERDDLFVDLLERWWRAEGRPVDVINAGTEGWSTDQEVVWLERHGAAYEPDLVLLLAYENDLYWSGELRYLRFPKPRFNTTGSREPVVLQDPGPQPWHQRTAVGRLFSGFGAAPRRWSPGAGRMLEMEHAAYWRDPPGFLDEAIARTRSALEVAQATCAAMGARLVVVPIPGKAAIVPRAKEALEAQILGLDPLSGLRRKLKGAPDPRTLPELAPETAWSPDQPVETFLALARELSIEAIDVRADLRARAAAGETLYYEADWHFDPSGNRAFATALHDAIDARKLLPEDAAPRVAASIEPERAKGGGFGWVPWYAGLVLVLGTLYGRTYRDVPLWRAYGFVAGMLGLVFAIAIGGTRLVGALPAAWGRLVLVAFVLALLGFVLVKLGRRIGTILELLVAFTRRGHWYLMPLVVVLLTIGSLLVVAASSPLVAPFIYTLF